MASQSRLRVVLAGAPLDNGNRGVEALGRSVVDHLVASGHLERVSVLDDGWGVRPDAEQARVEFLGVRLSRRWHRRESWARIRADQALGGLGNPVVDRFARADVVLDISGGDSFTQIYGPHRFATVCAPKQAALRAGAPLVLLPQTFGPFRTAAARARAARIVNAAALAYSRDAWSHQQLLDLAGGSARPGALREGVDVAFALGTQRPDEATAEQVEARAEQLLVGVNVSGLLVARGAQATFGLAGDYLATMIQLVQALIAQDAHVMLVPHVHDDTDRENDLSAIRAVRQALTPAEAERTWMLPAQLRAKELKWAIARSQWFTGSRMHATIAALSSQVPTFGYAYSDKARGVFGTCGVAEHSTDARGVAGAAAVEAALAHFAARKQTRAVLAEKVPAVVTRASAQLDEILQDCASRR